MTENTQNIDIPLEDIQQKKKCGRPNTTNLQFDKTNPKEYFNGYYRNIRSAEVECECGALVQKASLTRHKKRYAHTKRMKKLDEA